MDRLANWQIDNYVIWLKDIFSEKVLLSQLF